MDTTQHWYEMIYSIPLFQFLREHVAAISISLYLLWYVKAYLSRTELIAKDGSLIYQLVNKLPSFHSGYKPTVWCFPATLNTVIFALIQKCINHQYEREHLKTNDGGMIAIDWANQTETTNKLVLLVLPGLTGSSKENYVTHIVDKGVKLNCKTVVMNYRGIECELKTARTYCASNYEDLHMVVTHIHEKYKDHKIFAIGISLGGIKLGGYLAKYYDDSLINNAMIVSAPFNVFYSAQELEKTYNFFMFNRHLTKNLSRYFSKHQHLFEADGRYDCAAIAKCNSIRDFDTQFVSKQFGYDSCEAYYKDSCLDNKIGNIRVPTLFLNAADDMFSPERAFPLDKFRSSEYIAMVMTRYGGHISFIGKISSITSSSSFE
jgi:abhydrolase domain-containing protein 1/3